jgi:hypothetical protein
MRFRPGARFGGLSLGIVVTFLNPVGCAPVPDHAAHTVVEYAHDRALRSQELARCLNDPGTLGGTADCVNVREAERRAGVGSLKDLPPLRLPDSKQ